MAGARQSCGILFFGRVGWEGRKNAGLRPQTAKNPPAERRGHYVAAQLSLATAPILRSFFLAVTSTHVSLSGGSGLAVRLFNRELYASPSTRVPCDFVFFAVEQVLYIQVVKILRKHKIDCMCNVTTSHAWAVGGYGGATQIGHAEFQHDAPRRQPASYEREAATCMHAYGNLHFDYKTKEIDQKKT